eukprot:810250-Rhodomonas_salina.2
MAFGFCALVLHAGLRVLQLHRTHLVPPYSRISILYRIRYSYHLIPASGAHARATTLPNQYRSPLQTTLIRTEAALTST